MRKQIRKGVFETNSSSTHVVSISNYLAFLTDEQYQKYEKGEIIISKYGKVIDVEELRQKLLDEWKKCKKNEWPKSAYGTDRKTFIEQEINSNDVNREWHDDVKILHKEKEFNGEKIHVISLAWGDVEEKYIG